MKRFLSSIVIVLFMCVSVQAVEFNLDAQDYGYSAKECAWSMKVEYDESVQNAEDIEQEARDLNDWWVSQGNPSLLNFIRRGHPMRAEYLQMMVDRNNAHGHYSTAYADYTEGATAWFAGENNYLDHIAWHFQQPIPPDQTGTWLCPEGTEAACITYSNNKWVWAMTKCGGTDWTVWHGTGIELIINTTYDLGACRDFYYALEDSEKVVEFWMDVLDYIYQEMNAT